MNPSALEAHLHEIDDQGYTILENAIEPELIAELRDTIRRIHVEQGIEPRNTPAEGWATLRMYNLLAKGAVFQRVPVHDQVLPIVEAFANFSYLGQVPDNRTVSSQDPMDPFRFNTTENSFFDDNYWNANVVAGIRLNWQAFDGFARSARVEQSEIAARRTR